MFAKKLMQISCAKRYKFMKIFFMMTLLQNKLTTAFTQPLQTPNSRPHKHHHNRLSGSTQTPSQQIVWINTDTITTDCTDQHKHHHNRLSGSTQTPSQQIVWINTDTITTDCLDQRYQSSAMSTFLYVSPGLVVHCMPYH